MIRQRRLAIVLSVSLGALIVITAAYVSPSFAATLYVGTEEATDYPTIQDALAAAGDGDTVLIRSGTYTENIVIDKPGITLAPTFGAEVILDGTVTVTDAAGGVHIEGIMPPEAQSIEIEIGDGIQWPAALPPGTYNRVIELAGGTSTYDVTLGDVTVDAALESAAGAYIYTSGDNSTVSHTGTIKVTTSEVTSSARGASILTGNVGQASLEVVDVEAGDLTIGVHFFTGSGGQLALTGNVASHARNSGSVSIGVTLRGQTDISTETRGVAVDAGAHAVGIDFNVANRGALTVLGNTNVVARDDGSVAYGVAFGAGDDSSLEIGDVIVEGGGLARGVTTTYPPDTIVVTEGLENNVEIQIGHVQVTARDAGSQAYGVDLQAEHEVALTVDKVEAEGGQLARGVWLTAGDNGTLTHTDIISVTARDADSHAYGVDVQVGDEFSATVGSVTASGGSLVRGVAVTSGHAGSIEMQGDVTARSTHGQAHGIFVRAGDDFHATVKSVAVEGDNNAVQGVALDVGAGGVLSHEGLIDVTGTSATATVRGINVTAEANFSASVGNVTANGPRNALGIFWTSTDGASLNQTGAIRATTTDMGGSSGGASIYANDGLSVNVDEVEATAQGANSSADGVYVQAGQGLEGTFGSLTAEATLEARGLTVLADDDAKLEIGAITAAAVNAGASATGAQVNAGKDLTASFGDISVTGGGLASGIVLEATDDGSLTHTGSIDVTGHDADSTAQGVSVKSIGVMSATVDAVNVEGGTSATGISWETTGDGGSLTQKGAIDVTTREALSDAFGIDVAAQNEFSLTVEREIAVSSGNVARGVSYRVGNSGHLATVGNVTATSANGQAAGIFVQAADHFRADVKNVGAESANGRAQGVALSLGAGGSLTHEGLIEATSTSATATASGIEVAAGEDFSAIIDSVDVEGIAKAVGVNVNLGSGASLTQTGTLRALTTGDGGSARGIEMRAVDSLIMEVADVGVMSSGADSTATGVFGSAGDDFEGTYGMVSVTAEKQSWGVSVNVGDRATIEVDSVETVSRADDSEAYGVQVIGGDDLTVRLGEVKANAKRVTWAVTTTGDDLALEIDTVTAEAGAFAYGVIVRGGSSKVTMRGDVSATTHTLAQALSVQSVVANVTNEGNVYAAANNATGVILGSLGLTEQVEFHNLGVVETSANTGSAVVVNVTEGAIIQNDGTIDAGTGNSIYAQNSTGSVTLANTATIRGTVRMGQGADTLSVSETGRIVGDVLMGHGSDRLLLESNASIEGGVNLGAGDDQATIHHGAVLTGMLDGNVGDDSLTLEGDAAASSWTRLSARNIEQTSIHGGAWQWGVGTDLGTVEVDDAYLRIDDSVSIADLQLRSGVLVGEGNVKGTVVNDAGIVSPGNSFGILTITGDYTQGPDGVLYIELDASEAPLAGVNYDQLVIVGGTAVFEDGTTVRVVPFFGPTLPDRAEYIIVDGDVAFDPDTIGFEIELPRLLFYDGWLEEGSMMLILGVTPFDAVAETQNQAAVAQSLTEAMGLPDTDLDDLLDWLKGLDPDEAEAARAAYDSLSGEVYSHLPTLASLRMDSLVTAIGRGIVEPEADPKYRVWAVRYEDRGEIRPGPGTAASSFRLSGTIAGADILSGPTSRIGFSIGGGSDSLTMDERASKVSGGGYQLGLYGHFDVGRARLTAVLGYGKGTQHSRRTVQFGGVKRQAEADFSTTDNVVWIEARFRGLRRTGLTIEPVVSFGHYSTGNDFFTEDGAGTAGLAVEARTVSWRRGRLGVEMTANVLTLGSGTVSLRASVAWVNDFSPDLRAYQGSLKGATGAPFSIHGTTAEHSGVEASLGLTGHWRHSMTWRLDYTGDFRSDTRSHALMAGVGFAF